MAGEKNKKLSVYLSMLLRHAPEEAGLSMDIHGWVSVEELIQGINQKGKYSIDLERLERIVKSDSKSRYRFSEDKLKIKACQGHSIPWVIPQIEYGQPPEFLYQLVRCPVMQYICRRILQKPGSLRFAGAKNR